MEEVELTISIKKYAGKQELLAEEQGLYNAAIKSIETAYAPYSNFFVGAAVLMENGEIVIGSNQENVASPTSLCAERVALFAAGSQLPKQMVKAIAIVASSNRFKVTSPIAPCGACRQAIAETEQRFNSPVKVIFGTKEGIVYSANSIKELLPFLFYEKRLKKQE